MSDDDEWRSALYADDYEPDAPDPAEYAGSANRNDSHCPDCWAQIQQGGCKKHRNINPRQENA